MKRLAIFLFLITFSISFADVVDTLKQKMKNIGTIKADFILKVKYEDFNDTDVYGGNITLNKKGQILVKYNKNYRMVIYVNKNTIKYYNPEDEQTYTKKVKKEFFLELFQTFMRNGDISKFFKKIEEKKLKNGDIKLVLIPKGKYKKDGLKRVVFILDKNLKIKRLTLTTDDNQMDYRFKNVRYYKRIENLKFTKKI